MLKDECKHLDWDWNSDDCAICSDCGALLRSRCEVCGGEGIIQEDEYEGDWINYGPNLITCPDCGGSGYVVWEASGTEDPQAAGEQQA